MEIYQVTNTQIRKGANMNGDLPGEEYTKMLTYKYELTLEQEKTPNQRIECFLIKTTTKTKCLQNSGTMDHAPAAAGLAYRLKLQMQVSCRIFVEMFPYRLEKNSSSMQICRVWRFFSIRYNDDPLYRTQFRSKSTHVSN